MLPGTLFPLRESSLSKVSPHPVRENVNNDETSAPPGSDWTSNHPTVVEGVVAIGGEEGNGETVVVVEGNGQPMTPQVPRPPLQPRGSPLHFRAQPPGATLPEVRKHSVGRTVSLDNTTTDEMWDGFDGGNPPPSMADIQVSRGKGPDPSGGGGKGDKVEGDRPGGSTASIPGTPKTPRAALERRKSNLTSQVKVTFFNPQSKFFYRWDLVIAGLLLYTAIVTPFEISFLETNLGVLFFINRIVDVLFVVDMIWNFCLPVQDDNGEWKTRRKDIAMRYIKGWFPLDLISVLPYDIIGYIAKNSVASGLKILRIMRLMRLAKLLRILRAGRIFQRWEATMSIDYAKVALMKFVVVIIMLAHWLACLWHMVSVLESEEGEEDLPLDERTFTWVVKYAPYSDLDSVWATYVTSMYWSVATLTTLCYGDVVPTTDAERVFVTICAMLAATCYAYIIGNVCSIVSQFDAEQSKFYALMDGLNGFMREKNIPQELRVRLRDYFRFQRHNSPMHDSHHLLLAMSPSLKAEVAHILHSKWITNVSCFKGCSDEFIVAMSMTLTSETYGAHEEIVRAGEEATKMYIIDRGLVARNGRILMPGSTCGEDITLRPEDPYPRKWSARTMTNTVVQVLHLSDLNSILGDFPHERAKVRRASIKQIVKDTILAYARVVRLMLDRYPEADMEDFTRDVETCWRDPEKLPQKYAGRVWLRNLMADPEMHDKVIAAATTIQAGFRMSIFRRGYLERRAAKSAFADGQRRMVTFLRTSGLYEYESLLTRHMVTYEMLESVQVEHLVTIGVPLGHAFQILDAYVASKIAEKKRHLVGGGGAGLVRKGSAVGRGRGGGGGGSSATISAKNLAGAKSFRASL